MSPSAVRPARPPSALRRVIESEAGGGILLMVVAALALIAANSPVSVAYFGALKIYVFGLSVMHWINDGLMAVFFLLVGLEIKREFLDGQLSTWPRRVLPGIAAGGGMLVPALIYVGFNQGSPETLRGWAIPAATDIAFALGVLALLGSRVPASLKVFLTAIAILDDLGAVVIIAVFYTSDLSFPMLGAAALGLALLTGLNRAGVTRLAPYLLIGLAIWYFVLKSGVHATIAGVAVALTIPLQPSPGRPESPDSPLHRLEHRLHPWSVYLIVPVFGFANAGLSFEGLSPGILLTPVPLGVALGLFIGKQIGVFAFTVATIRMGLADVPAGATRLQVYGVALLCGIGFTMSLFIGNLAFPNSPELIDATKIGVLSGSLLSAVFGFALLRVARPESPPRQSRPAASA